MKIDQTLRDELNNRVESLLELMNGMPNGYLYQQMIRTVLKMTHEPQDRGELKLINSALKELRYAFLMYASYRDMKKVTIFGSARTKPEHPDYQLAFQTSKLLAEKGFGVITGASGGIMAAGNNGAGRNASFGCNIRLPFEQEPNESLIDNPRLVTFKYFFTRKVIFVKESHAVILLPGGFGTLDEGFETLTLIQTGKSDPKPLILLEHPGGTYWSAWESFIYDKVLGGGKISPNDVKLFSFHSTAETVVEEIEKFYRVYNSSRYVADKFVIYCNHQISSETIDHLNKEFNDMIAEGSITQTTGPLEEELGDEDIPDLPRLVFRFDRASYGRLHQLINAINEIG